VSVCVKEIKRERVFVRVSLCVCGRGGRGMGGGGFTACLSVCEHMCVGRRVCVGVCMRARVRGYAARSHFRIRMHCTTSF